MVDAIRGEDYQCNASPSKKKILLGRYFIPKYQRNLIFAASCLIEFYLSYIRLQTMGIFFSLSASSLFKNLETWHEFDGIIKDQT